MLVGVLAFGGTARADSVPIKNQALLLLRILAYDHNLGGRTDSNKVTIVIVSKAGNSDSDQVASELASVIRDIAKSTTIANNAIRVARVSFSDKTFDSDLASQKGAALYVAPGLGDSVHAITGATQSRKLLSFGGSEDYVTAGIAVGFVLDDTRPQILVNLPSSRREGADLDVALLKAAKIVKK
jgi:hypothetical protein